MCPKTYLKWKHVSLLRSKLEFFEEKRYSSRMKVPHQKTMCFCDHDHQLGVEMKFSAIAPSRNSKVTAIFNASGLTCTISTPATLFFLKFILQQTRRKYQNHPDLTLESSRVYLNECLTLRAIFTNNIFLFIAKPKWRRRRKVVKKSGVEDYIPWCHWSCFCFCFLRTVLVKNDLDSVSKEDS